MRHDLGPRGGWIVLGAALAYAAWLGARWLPVDIHDRELAAFLGRVWDIRAELAAGRLPLWTSHFLSGSSYGLHHVQGLYLLPWLLFSLAADLHRAGKLTLLLAIAAAGPAMYLCARRLLRSDAAALLAALAYLLHPQPLLRAAESGHVTVVLLYPLVPLLWLQLVRTLEEGGAAAVVPGAVVTTLALWAQNKQALVQLFFVGVYVAHFLVTRPERGPALRALLQLGGLTLLLSAFLLVPALREAREVKLLEGEPVSGWQQTYALKGPLALVDRGGVLTGLVRQKAQAALQGGDDVRRARAQRLLLLGDPAQAKYAGWVLLPLAAAGGAGGGPFLGLFCLALVLGSGASLGAATWETTAALWAVAGPGAALALSAAGLAPLLLLGWAARRAVARRALLLPLGLAAVLVPAFPLLAALPLLRDIRAPEVFFDLPGAFLLALLAGRALQRGLDRWQGLPPARAVQAAALLGLLLCLDFWPAQRALTAGVAPARTLRNLEETYAALRADPDFARVYVRSRRYFHLLGPSYSGKGLVNEAFYDWMSPRGTGRLRQAGRGAPEAHRQLLDLLAARYVVFDKSGPAPFGLAGPVQPEWLAYYRRTLPVLREDEDFVVFRNPTARPYVSAYGRAALAPGAEDPRTALLLASRGVALVRAPGAALDPRLLVAAHGTEPPPGAEPLPLTELVVERPAAGLLRLRLRLPRPGVVVLAESYFPGWTATVDGRARGVLSACGGLLGIDLPEGAHEVTLRFEAPPSYGLAALVSLLSLAGAVCAWGRARRKGGAA